ncbi:MAG: MBL fold metallo-hydrolase [Bacteriovoracales bacterium]|nr:MBL fold metallo-hydrolase [Bacteriovoracales bacterium]
MTKGVNTLVVLGSGMSTGVPMIGCHCPVCTHSDSKNRRLRSSVFLKTAGGAHLLVDAGPDLRTQLLREGIERVDGALITHEHADHCHGLDDLRPLSFKLQEGLPIYAPSRIKDKIVQKFSYGFQRKKGVEGAKGRAPGGVPRFNLVEIGEGKGEIGEEAFEFFFNPHGPIETLALIHHKMAYLVDCHEIKPKRVEELRQKNLDLLLLDCTGLRPHPAHLHLEKALHYAQKIAPKRCGLIHLGHDFEHNQLENDLKREFSGSGGGPSIFPVYDGQELSYGI